MLLPRTRLLTATQRSTLATFLARHQPGFALEQPFYTDPDIYELDLERAIIPYWQFVGHTARIPAVGDFFLTNIAGESIIITRDKEGEVHALLNVCRHRGSRVCLKDEGQASRFACPYHAWVYAADGTLLAARKMPENFDKTTYGLKSFPVRTIEGLIFINLSDDPVPFDDVVRDGIEFLQPHALSQAKIAARQVWHVQANWKLVMENFRECYHCAPTHPEYCSVMDHGLNDALDRFQMEPEFANYAKDWYEADAARGRPPVQEGRRSEHWHLCGRYPIREGFLTQSQDGKPVAPLMGSLHEYDGGVTTLSVYPLHYTAASCDYATLFRFAPLDVQLTEVELTWLVDESAVAGRDYNVDEVKWMWQVTTEQDKKIVDDNQAGVNSRFYRPGPYSDFEPDVKQFIAWYLERLGGRDAVD